MTDPKNRPLIPEELKRKLQKRMNGVWATVFGTIGISAALAAYYTNHFQTYYASSDLLDALKISSIVSFILFSVYISLFITTKRALKGSFAGNELLYVLKRREITTYALHVMRDPSFAVEDVVRAMEWLGSDKSRFEFSKRILAENAGASPVVDRRMKIFELLRAAIAKEPDLGRSHYFSRQMDNALWGESDGWLEWLKAEGALGSLSEHKAESTPETTQEYIEEPENPGAYNDVDSNEEAMDVIRQEVSDPELVVQAWKFLIRNNDIATFDSAIHQLSQEAKNSAIVSSRLQALPAEDFSTSTSGLDQTALTFEEAAGILLNPKSFVSSVLSAARWLKNNTAPEKRRKLVDSQPSKIPDPKIILRLDWLRAEGLLDEPRPLPGFQNSKTRIRD